MKREAVNTKKIKVVEKVIPSEYRKGRKFKIYGQAYKVEGLVEINVKQKSKAFLNTLLHELSHCIFPEMAEYRVSKIAGMLTDAIWKKGFRRIAK